ncbi:ABC transporter substrate-binding protein [Siminovitchia terrae]|nr:spermidine/putrescine ABC transporter substrate-binding protein [Siminovitchia terrae]
MCTACGSSKTSQTGQSNELNIFGFDEDIPKKVIEDFEKETGIKVNFSTFSSNEEMYAKISAGKHSYDLINMGTYYVEIFIKEGLAEKINKNKITNYKNIDEQFLGVVSNDPDDLYSVPYYWGEEVIAINTDLVKKDVKSYEDLFDPEFENSLVVLDDSRTMIGAMLQTLGYSANTQNKEEMDKAKQLLKKLKPNIKIFDSSNAKILLVSNEVKGGIVYGGEANLAIRENPSIKKIYPKEFLGLFQGNWVIPKGAANNVNAHKFIDFILRPEVGKEIVMTSPYNTPNTEVLEILPEDIRKEIDIPKEEIERGTYGVDIGEATPYFDQVWAEFKSQ